MIVEIDPKSGFCFGVVRAITEAERAIEECGRIFSLGDIVHNSVEVARLEQRGLHPLSHAEIGRASGQTLLIRAHGEPPTTYSLAKDNDITIIDATCPVVARLQQHVKRAYETMQALGGQVVLFGKKGHAEVVGLTGQVNDEVCVVEKEADLIDVDFSRPIYFLSQTTQSRSMFDKLAREILQRANDPDKVTVEDTICRQVSSREEHLRNFVRRFDLILFVCGRKSSNGRVLYEMCAAEHDKCYNIESDEDLQPQWFEGVNSVGICGASSTPTWLMEKVANNIITK